MVPGNRADRGAVPGRNRKRFEIVHCGSLAKDRKPLRQPIAWGALWATSHFFNRKIVADGVGLVAGADGCSGTGGEGQCRRPVPAYAQRTLGMQKTTGLVLAGLMIFLTVSLVSIFGAAARESQLEPGIEIPAAGRSRARIVMAVAAVAVVRHSVFGRQCGGRRLPRPRRTPTFTKRHRSKFSLSGENTLVLKIGPSPWHEQRKQMQLDSIIPDHGHLMHLFLLRMAGDG